MATISNTKEDHVIVAAQWMYRWTKANPWLAWLIPHNVIETFNRAVKALEEK